MKWRGWVENWARFSPRVLIVAIPALALAGFAVGGALGVLVVCASLGLAFWSRQDRVPVAVDRPLSHQDLVALVGANLAKAQPNGGTCLLVIDLSVEGPAPANHLDTLPGVLRSILRSNDIVCDLATGELAVVISARQGMNAEVALTLARRLQTAAEMPMLVDLPKVRVRAAVGVASTPQRGEAINARTLVEGARDALTRARATSPSGLVSADPPARPVPVDMSLVIEARRALDTDQIVPWFQPQVCARTGALTGVEALARWEHPQRGIIAPGGFLPALNQAGVGTRLGEVMLHHACAAIQKWEAAGLHVPTVALNLSEEELTIPGFARRIAWDLEAHGVAPHRLRIEILETVAASSADGIPGANIAELRDMGCPIDLDDFGTGNATIAAVERFGVGRLKIDRSFVSGLDRDPRQQKLVSAVIAMASHMGVDTLAEGIETPEEHKILAELGCGQVQGFAIARPMPQQAILDWAQMQAALFKDEFRQPQGAVRG